MAETIRGRLWSWEIVALGVVRKRPWPAAHGATLVGGPAGIVRFDSLAVAESRNICLAALDACAILEMNPDGIVVRRHAAQDMLVTISVSAAQVYAQPMWPCLTKVRQLRSIDRMRVSRFITSTIRIRLIRSRDRKLWPRSALTLSGAESATRVACIDQSESRRQL